MTAQDKKNKEQLILEVAEREFFAKGFDGARTMTIAQEAGVTHAMLHYYFRTKEQLFERIISDKFELISQMVLSVLGNAQLPLVERLKEGISSHFDLVAANPLLPRFLITEMAAEYFKLTDGVYSYSEALALLEDCQVDVILSIPRGFEHDLSSAQPKKLSVDANAVKLVCLSYR